MQETCSSCGTCFETDILIDYLRHLKSLPSRTVCCEAAYSNFILQNLVQYRKIQIIIHYLKSRLKKLLLIKDFFIFFSMEYMLTTTIRIF